MRSKLLAMMVIFSFLAVLGLVTSYFSENIDEPLDSGTVFEELKNGQIIFRVTTRADEKYPDDYFAQELATPFANYMEKEFEDELPKFGLSDSVLRSLGAVLTSKGTLIDIGDHQAFLAAIKIGPIEDGKSLWSLYLMGNGQTKSISAQCIGLSETMESVFIGECENRFRGLISGKDIK